MFRIIPHNLVSEVSVKGYKKPKPAFKDDKKKDDKVTDKKFAAARKGAKPAFESQVSESAIDDEDVHLQSAHDALASRITKCKRDGKDCKALEARLAHIAALLKKV